MVTIYEESATGINIIKRSEHGLGRYLPPASAHPLSNGATGWIDEAWQWIVAAHGDPAIPLPPWSDAPALSRVTVSSPLLHRPFSTWNLGRSWDDLIKPFNFLLVADLDPFGLPPDACQGPIRLISPYATSSDGRELSWRNLYAPTGPSYRVATEEEDAAARPRTALVRGYGQVLCEYRMHPEYKFQGANGLVCTRATQGLLSRRSIHCLSIHHIGKEANRLEEVRAGIVALADQATTEYSGHDMLDFDRYVLPVLKSMSGREISRLLGIDRRTVDRIRQGQRPRPSLEEALLHLAARTAHLDLGGPPLHPGELPYSESRIWSLLAAWRLRDHGVRPSASSHSRLTLHAGRLARPKAVVEDTRALSFRRWVHGSIGPPT